MPSARFLAPLALGFLLLTPVEATSNPAHEQLYALPRASRAAILAKIAQSSGYACTGRDAAFKGIHRTTGQAFWRVDCAEGRKSYMISIDADAGGSTKVLDCAISRALEKMAGKVGKDLCFDPW